MVSPQGVDAIDMAPSIDTPRVTPSSPRVGEDITISARVKHKSGIESVKLTILNIRPDPFDMVSTGDDLYSATFRYDKDSKSYFFDSSPINIISNTYSGTIQATAKEGIRRINNKQIPFTVRTETGGAPPVSTAATTATAAVTTTTAVPSSITIDSTPRISVSHNFAPLEAPERVSLSAVDTIILHHTGGDSPSTAYAKLKTDKNSVHYIIDTNGVIYYVVDEKKSAQHAGSYNERSIGIEIVNTGYKSMEFTNAQYTSISNLITDIVGRWPGIKYDDQHILAHYQVPSDGKWDPSPNFDWSRIGLPTHILLAALGKSPELGYGYT